MTYKLFYFLDDISPLKSIPEMAEDIITGSRLALSRAITLVESTNAVHRAKATELLEHLLDKRERRTISRKPTYRVGISGPPGVGKSTMIEAFGLYLIEQRHKVAVLSIDPSSDRTGGSILGDKTRMVDLSRHPSAYIRPSPSRCSLGGVSPATGESIQLCEAGDFDVVIVETVGVGQSEGAVRELVDTMLLVVPPAGGDELQGIKKGIVELCDVVVVNKADGTLLPTARHTKVEYMHALQILRHEKGDWKPTVIMISSLDADKKGIKKMWEIITKHHTYIEQNETLAIYRGKQNIKSMWMQLQQKLLEIIQNESALNETVMSMEDKVSLHLKTPRGAADSVLARSVFSKYVQSNQSSSSSSQSTPQ